MLTFFKTKIDNKNYYQHKKMIPNLKKIPLYPKTKIS